MKKEWSPKWISSSQARKQRKFRHNAPLHVRHKMLSAHLSKDLRHQYKIRSFPVRKGDELQVMRGKFRKFKGTVERIDMRALKVYIDGVKTKKTDGREVSVALEPSNLKIVRFNLEDKKRQKALERKKSKTARLETKREMEKKEKEIKKIEGKKKEMGKEKSEIKKEADKSKTETIIKETKKLEEAE